MKYNISKKLFEAVMVCNATEFRISSFSIFTQRGCHININDFFFKCKEWAYKQKIKKADTYHNGCGRSACGTMKNINLHTGINNKDTYYCKVSPYGDKNIDLSYFGFTYNLPYAMPLSDLIFTADSEQQAVFDACQWILEQQ